MAPQSRRTAALDKAGRLSTYNVMSILPMWNVFGLGQGGFGFRKATGAQIDYIQFAGLEQVDD
ncbi:hypothetical protein MPC4_10246 [Methylocella tundrae]|uniref:Uncharacterized protein n=1 Tax=Methylocella tundrae TaxID=227605 RepID=A0A8B6M0F4_METTU|nr:hypothetical protein MPC1_10130002 [Methylocella tundrae]VTZ48296.1 hypothetical protein MPC4_10246 [Methylocella tundrae]